FHGCSPFAFDSPARCPATSTNHTQSFSIGRGADTLMQFNVKVVDPNSSVAVPMPALGARRSSTPAIQAQCPLYLQQHPNIGTAADRRLVPAPHSCGASKKRLQSVTR